MQVRGLQGQVRRLPVPAQGRQQRDDRFFGELQDDGQRPEGVESVELPYRVGATLVGAATRAYDAPTLPGIFPHPWGVNCLAIHEGAAS